MRVLICIFSVLLGSCGSQFPEFSSKPIEYKITPQNHGFLVEINPNTTGKITLLVPEQKAYAYYELQNGTQKYPIRYVVLPKSSEPNISDTVVLLQENYFQTVGHGFLACIGNDINEKKIIRMIWGGPPHWKFANSFSAHQREQNFEASCGELRKALYVGGTRFVLRKTWFGALAVAGYFDHMTMPNLEDAITHNMTRVLKFWNSLPEPYYFVSIRGTDSKKHGGTAQFQSFQLDLPSQQLDNVELDRLITHEYFHNWNGLKLNLEPSLDPIAHLDVWWFVEGFTDYYAYKLSMAPDTENFTNHSLAELKRNYHVNHNYHHLPYVQGRHIARQFEDYISRHSRKELKHVMHEIIQRSQQDPTFYLTRENILKVICEGNYMSCSDAQTILRNYVDFGI